MRAVVQFLRQAAEPCAALVQSLHGFVDGQFDSLLFDAKHVHCLLPDALGNALMRNVHDPSKDILRNWLNKLGDTLSRYALGNALLALKDLFHGVRHGHFNVLLLGALEEAMLVIVQDLLKKHFHDARHWAHQLSTHRYARDCAPDECPTHDM